MATTLRTLALMALVPLAGAGTVFAQAPSPAVPAAPTAPTPGTYTPDWASLDARPVPAWFEDAKFGIFIHWGVYSVPSWAPVGGDDIYLKYAEWYWQRLADGEPGFRAHHDSTYGADVRYQDFAPEFTAEMFAPDDWAALFERAGAKYVVLTSKHHEGFTLWPSAESWNWNAVDVGPHRDLAGELAEAVRARDLRMGFYYSLYEWFHPTYRDSVARYVDAHMLPQLRDLVTRYEPDVVWTDGEWDHPAGTWRSEEFLAWLFNDSPVAATVAVNDRWGAETRSRHGGYYTSEYGIVEDGAALDTAGARPWEECRGIGGSFGYNRNETLDDYLTSDSLVHLLVDVVSRGGNLLLNIGPTADGRIPVIMQQRLTDVGAWLARNGEAIYGTRAVRDLPAQAPGVRLTAKRDTLYAILTEWPGEELRLVLPGLPTGATATLVGGPGEALALRRAGDAVTVALPGFAPGEMGENAWVVRVAGGRP